MDNLALFLICLRPMKKIHVDLCMDNLARFLICVRPKKDPRKFVDFCMANLARFLICLKISVGTIWLDF